MLFRYPVNVFPTEYVDDPNFTGEWLYGGVADIISEYLTPEAEQTFRENGRYSIRPVEGLKIINLNNNFGERQEL